MSEIINSNRLRVSLYRWRDGRDDAKFHVSAWKSRDHGKDRLESNIHICCWPLVLHVKLRPDGKA